MLLVLNTLTILSEAVEIDNGKMLAGDITIIWRAITLLAFVN